jgi:protein-disulfide isomerase
MPASQRLRMVRARQARRQRRIRLAAAGGVATVLIAAAAAGVLARRHDATAAGPGSRPGGSYAPVTLNADNSVTMAQPGVSGPVLDVYEDFQCPLCRAFEKGNGGMIQRLADQGRLKVVYHPFTMFSDQPQQANSIRAWAAARCAPADLWVRYHNELYASQPPETTADGFPVRLLLRLGRKAGITSRGFAQCVQSQKYAAQNPPLSNQIINGGVNGAPVLTLNGKILSISPVSSGLRQQILSTSP